MGVFAALLSACGGGRSDVDAVQKALQAAAADGPELGEGSVKFQDSGTVGTVIDGVLAVTATDADQARTQYEAILERVVRAYAQQPRTRTASVLLEAHPDGDRNTRLLPTDVVAPSSGTTVTSDDLAAHFGI